VPGGVPLSRRGAGRRAAGAPARARAGRARKLPRPARPGRRAPGRGRPTHAGCSICRSGCLHAPRRRSGSRARKGGGQVAASGPARALRAHRPVVRELGRVYKHDQVYRCTLVSAHIFAACSLDGMRPHRGVRVWLPKVPANGECRPTAEDSRARLSLCHGLYHAELGAGNDACQSGHDTPRHRADVYSPPSRGAPACGAGDVENGCSPPTRDRRRCVVFCRGMQSVARIVPCTGRTLLAC